jgi:LacI family transcriptional regulator
MKNLKLADIAELANVSPTTVARVINNNGYVSKKNREIIEKIILETSYTPNKIAQGLKKKKTRTLGHIMPQSDENPFFTKISEAVEKAAYDANYQVITMMSNHKKEMEEEFISNMASRMVDGIIFTSTHHPKLVEKVIKMNIPVVMIERPDDVFGIDKVLFNDVEGGYLATNLLFDKGHVNIGFIGKNSDFIVEKGRYDGFTQACSKRKIKPNKEAIVLVQEYSIENGYLAAKQLIENNKNRVTGIFVASDIFVTGVLQYLYEARIRVPEEISIVSYDDTLSAMLSPRITSIAFPMEEIGKTAVDMIVNKIEKSSVSSKTVTISPFVMQRDSVRAITQVTSGEISR